MNKNERSIWRNLLWALAATPMIGLIGIVIITLIAALDYEIYKIQSSGRWWVMLIPAYTLSFIYFIYEPKIRRNLEKRREEGLVDGLILYWREQIAKQGKNQPSEPDIERMRDMFRSTLYLWAKSDPRIWSGFLPEGKQTDYLFDIVDNLIEVSELEKSETQELKD